MAGAPTALPVSRDPVEGLADWRRFVQDARKRKPTLRIGLVGKYVELEDAYLSVKESLMHAGLAIDYRSGDRMD